MTNQTHHSDSTDALSEGSKSSIASVASSGDLSVPPAPRAPAPAASIHTLGPWRVGTGTEAHSVLAKDGVGIAECWHRGDTAQQRANAARIVACVNACEGMTDPAEGILRLREEITARVPISEVDGLTDKERELIEALVPFAAMPTTAGTPGVKLDEVRDANIRAARHALSLVRSS